MVCDDCAPPGTPLMGMPTLPTAEPADVRALADGETLELAGLSLGVRHAPGHTLGSVVFTAQTADEPLLFSGDLLFAGSIGRTADSLVAGCEHRRTAAGRRDRGAVRARAADHGRPGAGRQPLPAAGHRAALRPEPDRADLRCRRRWRRTRRAG